LQNTNAFDASMSTQPVSACHAMAQRQAHLVERQRAENAHQRRLLLAQQRNAVPS
jgi:hypothetical protein